MSEHFDCIGRNYDVVLDSTSSDHGLEEMWFYQGDTGGTLTIFLHEAGLPMNLPPDGKVMCFFERKDKNIVQRELQLLTRSESKYVATIDNAILEVAGKVKCEVKVYHCENRTTFGTFEITSKKSMSIEGGVDTPHKYDLIQTVMHQGLRLDGVDQSLQLNQEGHDSFVESLNAHQQAIENIRQLLNETDVKIGNNLEAVNNSIEETNKSIDNKVSEINTALDQLEQSFTQSLSALANSVADNIADTNDKISQLDTKTANSFQEFNTKLLEFETATGLKFEDVLKTYTALSNMTEQSFNNVSDQIDALSATKVSVIESVEEPDTTHLPVGTLWIKPQIIEEQPK